MLDCFPPPPPPLRLAVSSSVVTYLPYGTGKVHVRSFVRSLCCEFPVTPLGSRECASSRLVSSHRIASRPLSFIGLRANFHLHAPVPVAHRSVPLLPPPREAPGRSSGRPTRRESLRSPKRPGRVPLFRSGRHLSPADPPAPGWRSPAVARGGRPPVP